MNKQPSTTGMTQEQALVLRAQMGEQMLADLIEIAVLENQTVMRMQVDAHGIFHQAGPCPQLTPLINAAKQRLNQY